MDTMSKYQDWISEDGLTLIRGWARDGLTDKEIADKIGINACTICDWKKKHPQFSNALKKGKEVVDNEAEDALIKSFQGFYYTETTYEFQYNDEKDEWEKIPVKAVEKYMPPNVGALAFWLKNRRKEKWRDKPEQSKQNNDDSLTLNIVFPDK